MVDLSARFIIWQALARAEAGRLNPEDVELIQKIDAKIREQQRAAQVLLFFPQAGDVLAGVHWLMTASVCRHFMKGRGSVGRRCLICLTRATRRMTMERTCLKWTPRTLVSVIRLTSP